MLTRVGVWQWRKSVFVRVRDFSQRPGKLEHFVSCWSIYSTSTPLNASVLLTCAFTVSWAHCAQKNSHSYTSIALTITTAVWTFFTMLQIGELYSEVSVKSPLLSILKTCGDKIQISADTVVYLLNYGKCIIKSKVTYSITSVGHGADAGFLAVSPQVTLVINPVVGCRYFPAGTQLLSHPKRSLPWPVPNYTVWWQRHTGVSSLPKAATQWCPARTETQM